MTKSLKIMLLTLCILTLIFGTSLAEVKCRDVSKHHWAFSALEVALPIMGGCEFEGDILIDRYMMARVIEGLIKEFEIKFPGKEMELKLKDVPKNHPRTGAILMSINAGILQAYAGKFHGDKSINRYQMAVIINKLLELRGTHARVTKEPVELMDVGSAHWAYSAIQRAINAGVLISFDDKFHGDKFVNRYQLAVIVKNIVSALSVREWFDKGSVLINAGDYDGALRAYNKVIELDPNNASAYTHLGWANNGLENYQQAIKDLNKALTLDPNNHWANYHRGCAYNGLGNFQQAKKDLDKAIASVSDNTWPYTHRGWAHNGLGNYQQAIKDLNKAVTLDPNNVIAYIHLGWANNGLEKYQQAIKDLNKALKLDPNNKYIYVHKGWSYNGMGNYQQAIVNFNTAIELDPVYADGYYNLAAFYSHRGDKQKAITFLTKAIKLDANLKVRAKADASFNAIRNNKRFKELVH